MRKICKILMVLFCVILFSMNDTTILKADGQIIIDDESCPVKFKIYDILEERKKQAEAEEKK